MSIRVLDHFFKPCLTIELNILFWCIFLFLLLLWISVIGHQCEINPIPIKRLSSISTTHRITSYPRCCDVLEIQIVPKPNYHAHNFFFHYIPKEHFHKSANQDRHVLVYIIYIYLAIKTVYPICTPIMVYALLQCPICTMSLDMRDLS